MKIKTNTKRLILGLSTLGIMGASYFIGERDNLKESDFDNATWYEVPNTAGITIEQAYENEDIPHNEYNKEIYRSEVKKRNKGIESMIFIPDLDGSEEESKEVKADSMFQKS